MNLWCLRSLFISRNLILMERFMFQIGSRSSVYSPESNVRKTGSYIYEEFMPTDGTDVKVCKFIFQMLCSDFSEGRNTYLYSKVCLFCFDHWKLLFAIK